jgi:lipopolysaccharide/colanic/teichoic acid biosynthesis glycosyltransferase
MQMNEISNIAQTEKNDPRITKIGAFMRKTSVDELPQFFNVLMGNMSVVEYAHNCYTIQTVCFYGRKIYDSALCKNGITGWAQVNGFRGAITNVDDMKKG